MTTLLGASAWAEESPEQQQYRASAGTTTSTFITGQLEDFLTPVRDWSQIWKKNTSFYTFIAMLPSESVAEPLARGMEIMDAYRRALSTQSPVKVLVAEEEARSPLNEPMEWKFPASIDEDALRLLRKVITEHFEIEPELHLVAIYLRERESLPEFLLVEVNREAIPTGSVEPFYFSPTEEFPWPIYVADVTRSEWIRIRKGTISLPPGWSSKPLKIFNRADPLTELSLPEAA